MKFPALTKDVQIDYTAFSFVAPERVRFRYRLDGYDRAWNEVDGRRQAVYTNLPPGPYRFQVLASNNDGLWNEAGRGIRLFDSTRVLSNPLVSAPGRSGVRVGAVGPVSSARPADRHAIHLRFEERLAERTRIARELHDTLLQNIAGFALQLGGLSKR